jgi:hypothetical protein
MRDFLHNLLHLKMLRDVKYNLSARVEVSLMTGRANSFCPQYRAPWPGKVYLQILDYPFAPRRSLSSSMALILSPLD